jgi:hypothetical protein
LKKNEENPSIEERISDLERNFEALFKSINRRNQELVGQLLTLSLPMSNKRRLETTALILKTINLDDAILKSIFLRYFNEGIKSDLKFEDLIEPLINTLGFEKLWKIIDKEIIRERFGIVAESKWLAFEKQYPCKDEVKN